MSLVWWWIEIGPNAVAKMKKDSVRADIVDGVEIWKASNGFTRLTPNLENNRMSSRVFSSVEEARRAIEYMK